MLNKHSNDYMAMKAYGEKNHREHYHTLAALDRNSVSNMYESLDDYDEKYGNTYIKNVYTTKTDIRRLTNYLGSNKVDSLVFSTGKISFKRNVKNTLGGTQQARVYVEKLVNICTYGELKQRFAIVNC